MPAHQLLQMMVLTPVILGMLAAGRLGCGQTGPLTHVLASIAGFIVAVMGWEVPAPVVNHRTLRCIHSDGVDELAHPFRRGVLSDAVAPSGSTPRHQLTGMPLAGFAMTLLA